MFNVRKERNKKLFVLVITVLVILLVLFAGSIGRVATKKSFVLSYSNLVHKNYQEAHQDALKMKKAIERFLNNPNPETLELARQSWLNARSSYEQSEIFRFYNGPIDFYNDITGQEGPEKRIGSWPINPSYIDYVKDNKNSGIINQPDVKITQEFLITKNQENNEIDVSTGYHVIEFLLWGEDLSKDSSGNRPYTDYTLAKKENHNRREYLRLVTDLLVDDLKFLVDSWDKKKENSYANSFIKQDHSLIMSNILSSLATLSSYELSIKGMNNALESMSEEDEQSQFSDNTHNDFIYNVRGIQNVYFGEYRENKFNASLHDILKRKDRALASELAERLRTTEKLVSSLPNPIDREILSKNSTKENRHKLEEVIKSLQIQGELFKKAGKVLGVKVEVKS